ncbi:MAG: deoxyguanosinetriphosphate triphosphohydrolase [Clostridia bacterium]|nr:deoxyguanosinetriphosphate triphosphohydrolase [Candidatus Pelethousia sp.]NCB29779.1 deoxyguanosinetriphosphate triphosphohydrolase [Clostridia bacterium]
MGIQSEDFRRHVEELEERFLSPYAARASKSKGREYPLEECPVRTAFMRDRDRIIHCKSFRRLKHKTQVFLSPVGDHYRTRLTHTLEVNQIARTIARGLRLNEDLTEAIALGHDLGHTPFGHAGEDMLNELVPGGFEHNVQSLRVVEKLENNGKGLNLTFEVRDGILHHKRDGTPATLEGQVVSLADRIAYINHDIDDAIRASVISPADIPQRCNECMGSSHGERINSLICDILAQSFGTPQISMSSEMFNHFSLLREFMFERVYLNHEAKKEEEKGKHVIAELYRYYLAHVDRLPAEFRNNIDTDGAERVAADYIACMSDRYAITDYTRLFVPSEWV